MCRRMVTDHQRLEVYDVIKHIQSSNNPRCSRRALINGLLNPSQIALRTHTMGK